MNKFAIWFQFMVLVKNIETNPLILISITTSRLDGQTSEIWLNCWAPWRASAILGHVNRWLLAITRHCSSHIYVQCDHRVGRGLGPFWLGGPVMLQTSSLSINIDQSKAHADAGDRPRQTTYHFNGLLPSGSLPRWAECAECPSRRQLISSFSFWVSVSEDISSRRVKFSFVFCLKSAKSKWYVNPQMATYILPPLFKLCIIISR